MGGSTRGAAVGPGCRTSSLAASPPECPPDLEPSDVSELVVLQHTAAAGPSSFVEVLDARTSIAPWRLVEVTTPDDLPPDPTDLAGLVVMGGIMSATDPDANPWMPRELELLRQAVDAEVPVFGVCLGAQLLAAAHGGKVARRDTPRVGYRAVHRTAEASGDPVFGGWQDGASPLFVHEDEVVDLPDGAIPMLSCAEGTTGWRLGSAWAVQFHPEVDASQLASWVDLPAMDPMLERAGVDGVEVVAEGRTRDRSIVPIGRALIGRFIDAVVRPRVEGN
jgi:GMP synthase (glutamine-hydrolysing)